MAGIGRLIRIVILVAVALALILTVALPPPSAAAATAATDTGISTNDWGRVPFEAGLRDPYGRSSIRAVAAGPKGIVAVGRSPTGAAAWHSLDGLTWRRAIPPRSWTNGRGAGTELEDVVATDEGFVVVGHESGGPRRFLRRSGSIWTSEDGILWRRSATSIGPLPYGVVEHNGRLFAVSSGTRRGVPSTWWRSEDGREWERVARARDGALASDGSLMVAGNIGSMGFSTNGVTWSDAPVEPERGEHDNIYDVAPFAGGFVAVGVRQDRAASWLSSDGRSWVAAPRTIFTNAYIQYFSAVTTLQDGSLIAVANDDEGGGYVYGSGDGQDWDLLLQVPATSDESEGTFQDVVAVGERVLVVGEHPDGPRVISAAVWTDPAPEAFAAEGHEPTSCPDDQPTLAVLLEMAPASRVDCFGNRRLTFSAFVDHHPWPSPEQFFPRPHWLSIGMGGGHALPVAVGSHATMELVLSVDPRTRRRVRIPAGRWSIVTGHFDHPAASRCWEVERCRQAFVVTNLKHDSG